MKEWEFEWQERERLYMETLEAQKKYMESFNCEICGVSGSREQLLGGRMATLCNHHNNEWIVYARGLSLWKQYIDCGVVYDIAVYGNNKLCAEEAMHIKEGVLKSFYDLSGEWLEMAVTEERGRVFGPQANFAQIARGETNGG